MKNEKWGENIQAAAYNGARTVYHFLQKKNLCKPFLDLFYLEALVKTVMAFNMMWWFIGEKNGWEKSTFLLFNKFFFSSGIKKYAALYCCHNWFQFLMVPSLLSSVQFIFSSHHMNWAWENKEVMLMQKRILKRDFSEGNLRVCMTWQGSL